jgi:hypothetical protein
MGAHGIGLLDDDDGADFAHEILNSPSMDIIVDALKAIPLDDWDYVERPEGMRALLAAEVVADQMGHESGDLPDDIHSWAHEFGEPDDELIALARAAVQRVLRKSELRDLWNDSHHFGEWLAKTAGLADRLKWR